MIHHDLLTIAIIKIIIVGIVYMAITPIKNSIIFPAPFLGLSKFLVLT